MDSQGGSGGGMEGGVIEKKVGEGLFLTPCISSSCTVQGGMWHFLWNCDSEDGGEEESN